MSDRPRLLDCFCGAGGAAVGYSQAGFDVVGVDIAIQPRYPFPFIRDDAGDVLQQLVAGWSIGPSMPDGRRYQLRDFAAIHASPPCQRWTVGGRIHDSQWQHPDLIAPTRDRLRLTGKTWVIENVVGSPLHRPIRLCGTMFGLKVFRHRLFESSALLLAPDHPRHDGSTGASDGYSTLARGRNGYICVAGHNFIREEAAAAMGIDWMGSRHELAQAIPPAFTEFLGRQLMNAIGGAL